MTREQTIELLKDLRIAVDTGEDHNGVKSITVTLALKVEEEMIEIATDTVYPRWD